MRARAVIGANFGDEGKGLITDYLCDQGAGVVVRFNGGAQAGHTVVAPTWRHVFHHLGSGTFCGVPTYLSEYFVCNPILFLHEWEALHSMGWIAPVDVFAHPNCLVTTFADMIINQRKENARGLKRHGSCGVGVHETQVRSKVPELTITMADLWNEASLAGKLVEICGRWAQFRSGKEIGNAEEMIGEFILRCRRFADIVSPLGIAQCAKREPVFEGAQGLLLDQDNKEFWPHVTHSHTGMKNVRALCAQAGIDDVDVYYVSRTYLTRHGAGPLPEEWQYLSFADDTNVDHAFQGALRFAPLDMKALQRRCAADAKQDYRLVLTHCDQLAPPGSASLYSYGPMRWQITDEMEKAA